MQTLLERKGWRQVINKQGVKEEPRSRRGPPGQSKAVESMMKMKMKKKGNVHWLIHAVTFILPQPLTVINDE